MSVLSDVVKKCYNEAIRPQLPRKLGVRNGVVCRWPALLDDTEIDPDYEYAIVESIRDHVESDDTVVVVGGGFGVSAVHAARAGADDVTVYEASKRQTEVIREAVSINEAENIRVKHALVGPAKMVYNDDLGDAAVSHPDELPECDVLELDCEGAEMEILDEIDQRPRTIIVEVHPEFDVPIESVEDWFSKEGYHIVSREWEDESKQVEVLTGVRR